jgi:lipopolysaccharide/colanic/teichoic acid biosynthesis glycosyltransferase
MNNFIKRVKTALRSSISTILFIVVILVILIAIKPKIIGMFF